MVLTEVLYRSLHGVQYPTTRVKSAVRGGREIVKKSILLCGACTGQGPEGGAGPGGTAREPGRPRERPLRVQKFLDKF